MVSSTLPSSDSHLKRRKKPRQDENEAATAAGEELLDPVPNSISGSELVSDHAQQISSFPKAVKISVTKWHPSVMLVASSERYGTNRTGLMIENVSHGQLQALSSVSTGDSSMNSNSENSLFEYSPPPIMEGKGVEMMFNGKIHLVPTHSDWFSPYAVHQLERQVVPHFFSGITPDHSPEEYITLRNKIISQYLENPANKLAFADCQALVAKERLYDLSRIVRFLEDWGIINYMSSSRSRSQRYASLMSGSLIKEKPNGELIVQTGHLRSIDSLLLFDKPKCRAWSEDFGLSSPSIPSNAKNRKGNQNSDVRGLEFYRKLRERLSEYSCSYCFCPLPELRYQSQKEANKILCSDCYQDGKFVVGHSSIDFTRKDSRKDTSEPDGDGWTDQETLLLLEGLKKYKDKWDKIAEHVGTKSKTQCILHSLHLPVDIGCLGNIETNASFQIPFGNTPNPISSLVAFLASAVAPRVAAACARASIAVLSKGDSSSNANSPLTPETVKMAAKIGLSAAAMKAKLLAEEEEREMQKLSATIINHQLKRLELKLKQFAEVDRYLTKQREQVEKERHALSTEKVAMLTKHQQPSFTG